MIEQSRWLRPRYCGLVIGLVLGCADVTGPPRPPAKSPDYDGQTLFRGLVMGNGPAADFLSSRSDVPRLADVVKDPIQLERISRFQDRLITSIDRVNPSFFQEFAAAMKSGSHTRIQRMFQQTADVMLRTVLTLREAGDLKAAFKDRKALDEAVTKELASIDRNDPRTRTAVREVVDALYASVNSPERKDGLAPSFMMRDVDQGGGGGGGGCVYVYLAAVYVAVAVNGAVVSNYVVAIAIATYAAVTYGSIGTPETQLARERMIHAIATTLAV